MKVSEAIERLRRYPADAEVTALTVALVHTPPAVGPELDKALDDFVANKPPSIMKEG